MGVEIKIDTKGLQTLAQSLSPLAIDSLVRAAAFDAEGGAKRLAPVDTGFLRSSLSTHMIGPARAEVGASAEYAAFIEFGTGKSHAQPFLTPASEAAIARLRRVLEIIFARAS